MSDSKIEKAIKDASKSSEKPQEKIVFWTRLTTIILILTLIADITLRLLLK